MPEKKIDQLSEKTQRQIQELQSYEQIFQNLMMQKQAFQIELNETELAISELAKTNEDVYKLIGSIMIKASKKETEAELKKKKELIDLRLKTIEKQEEELGSETEKLRKEIMEELK